MNPSRAAAILGIAGAANPFGWNSKMPGGTYDLPAAACVWNSTNRQP